MRNCIICGSKTKLFYGGLYDDRFGAPGIYSVFYCPRCGFGRTDPVLQKEEIGEFYKKYYPLSAINTDVIKSSSKVRTVLLSWLSGVDNSGHLHIRRNSKVLDIGSGSGKSLLEIKNMGARAFGIEPDPTAQRIARKLKLNVYKGFVTDRQFSGKNFDFITASQVFEHEPDPINFLISAKRRLQKKGQIILSVPNFGSLYLKIFGSKWINWHVPYHINFFTKRSFEKLSKKVGLRIVGTRTITPNVWSLMQIRSLISFVKEGQKNQIWVSAASTEYVGNWLLSLKHYILRFFAIIFYILITPIIRIVDLLGLGDSLFVILEYEKQ